MAKPEANIDEIVLSAKLSGDGFSSELIKLQLKLGMLKGLSNATISISGNLCMLAV